MNKTKIPWVKNPDGTLGYSWNPITGCLNHVNGLCKGGGFPCYAYKLAHGRLRSRYLANTVLPCHDEPNHELHHSDPFYPRFWASKLDEILNHAYSRGKTTMLYGHKPKGIFVCDMSDLFGIGIPEQWTREVMDTIRENNQDRFYLLTKQAQSLAKYNPFPDNCWVGVTATTSKHFVDACNALIHVKAKAFYLSLEPLLEWHIDQDILEGDLTAQQIDWLIIGSQTKPLKHPRFEWVESIVNAADRAGVKVFIKPPLSDVMNIHRQEMPE